MHLTLAIVPCGFQSRSFLCAGFREYLTYGACTFNDVTYLSKRGLVARFLVKEIQDCQHFSGVGCRDGEGASSVRTAPKAGWVRTWGSQSARDHHLQ
jgi:hypothetical protein